MRRIPRVSFALIVVLSMLVWNSLLMTVKVHAVTSEPIVTLAQVKITSSNGQYVTLYNNSSSAVDMSTIKLLYFNNNDIKLSTSSKLIHLTGILPSQSYYMVSDDSLSVCYRMMISSASLGFSTSLGMVEVRHMTQTSPGAQITSELLDTFSWKGWKKPSATSTETGPPSIQDITPTILPTTSNSILQRVWPDGAQKVTGGGSWQTVTPNPLNPCELQYNETSVALNNEPASIVNVATSTIGTAEAQVNKGLAPPYLTELFPNPKTPQSDDTDEFIELYNPNESVFVLRGYRIEVGTSYAGGYTFTDEVLQPRTYSAFYITNTHAQLSNSEGRARLLSPERSVLSETPSYENAPDGSSWGSSGESWQWLTSPSPNAVNIANNISTPTTPASTKKSAGKVAGASTNTPSQSPSQLDDVAPLHPAILASVGFAAVAYALYEYRSDMANRIYKFRKYLRDRRAIRSRV